MLPSPRRILALWRNNPQWRASLNEIRQALRTSKAQTPRLTALLNTLVDQNKLRFERNRFQLEMTTPQPRARQLVSHGDGETLSGVFSAHPDGYGFVDLEEGKRSVFIPPRKDGGALDKDRVQVTIEQRGEAGRISGTISAIEKRERDLLRGFVHEEQDQLWLLPLNEKLPMVYLESEKTRKAPSYERGDFVEVRVHTYPPDAITAPIGSVQKVLPPPDTPARVIEAILADLQLPTVFSPQARKEARGFVLPEKAAEPPPHQREDLREYPFITIDGEDARDFDDAVCLRPAAGGGHKLLVAIADVAEYVQPGSALDAEARQRGTSIYFPEQVVPMLPERISNKLCSLQPKKPRLALVCEMDLDANGGRGNHRIYEAIIRSQVRLTYTQVQEFFDTGQPGVLPKAATSSAPMLKTMRQLALLLGELRGQRGALALELPEARFVFSSPGQPERIVSTLPSEATRLIEQFMLEANETVALHCERQDIPILYRVHDPPAADGLAQLRERLFNFGIALTDAQWGQPDIVCRLLERLEDHSHKQALTLLVLKAMAQARYRPRNDGHYGLAARHYTHFTSPIRRYPDLLVHRALKRKARGESMVLDPQAGEALSLCERNAAEAETRVNRLYTVLYMEPRLGEQFSATVSRVLPRGLAITLQGHFVQGWLPSEALPGGRYRFEERREVLRGAGRSIGFGTPLTVQLVRAERLSQQLVFEFVDWE